LPENAAFPVSISNSGNFRIGNNENNIRWRDGNPKTSFDAGRRVDQDPVIFPPQLITQADHIAGGDFNAAINEGVKQGYQEGYLRKSACHCFSRANTKDNTPAIIYTEVVPGDAPPEKQVHVFDFDDTLGVTTNATE
jgi:hypothetical protein